MLDRCDPGVLIVVGAATNTRSTDKWSWANFLCVLGFHWAPEIQTPLEPLAFNVALKRAVLGRDRLALGQYESEIVPLAMKAARADPGFSVDHMQFRKLPEGCVLSLVQWQSDRCRHARVHSEGDEPGV